jgi:hypothetical protein
LSRPAVANQPLEAAEVARFGGGPARWVVLALVLVSLVVSAVDVGYGYTTPLAPGSTSIGQRVCADPSNEASCEIRAPKSGETLVFGFSIRNDWPLPVTITGVAQPLTDLLAVDHVDVFPVDLGTTAFAAAQPFAPFALGQGEERMVLIVTRLSPCARQTDPGSSVEFTTMDLIYHWLWWTHTQSVRLLQPPTLSLAAGQC